MGFSHYDDEPESENAGLFADDNPESEHSGDYQALDSDSASEGLHGELFDAVIGLFNRWSPQFVRDCIDTEAQRRYIYDSLGVELRSRLGKVQTTSSDDVARERSMMMEELEKLREDNKNVVTLRERLESSRLSAERQKRAMADRIQDLQDQVATLEDKNERMALSTATRHAAQTDADSAGIAALKDDLAAREREIERLNALNEQLDTKARMADSMISELKNRLNGATQLSASLKADVERLTQENAMMNDEMAKVDEFSEQLTKVEELVARKDARIAELQAAAAEAGALGDEVKTLRDKISTVNAEKDALRKTIENNLYNQAHSENRLRAEIKKLKAQLGDSDGNEAVKSRRSKRRVKSGENNNADNNDSGTESLPEFGYRPPVRRQHPDDSSQMSLF